VRVSGARSGPHRVAAMPITRGPKAVKKAEGKPGSMQAYVRCLHCKRNQSRHFRTGRGNWSCRYCGELNPGPALSDRVIAVRKGAEPNAVVEEPASAAATGSRTPKRPVRGAPPKRLEAGKRADRASPEPAQENESPGAPAGSGAPPTKPPAKGSLYDRWVFGS
jgi:ribosomal protein L37AE/L43A